MVVRSIVAIQWNSPYPAVRALVVRGTASQIALAEWLINVGGGGLITAYTPSKYFQLVIYMMLAFGVCFELPVLLTFLQLAGVVKNATLRKYRRHSILGITIVVAVATPSNDPISLLALTIPLVLFYEATVWIGWVIQRRRARNPSHRLYDNRGTNAAK